MENNPINSKTFRFDTEPFHCPNMCSNGPFSSFLLKWWDPTIDSDLK